MQQTKWESTGHAPPHAAVFLDRDGVLNRANVVDGKPSPPSGENELDVLPDVGPALRDLKSHGFALYVITNQPDVARGKQKLSTVEAMHRILRDSLPVDDIFVCYHDDKDHCACRKPEPGLLIEAQRKHNVDFSQSYFVGDRWRDIDAGHSVGCKTILIDYGYRERKPAQPPDATVHSLREAADWIIAAVAKEPADEVRV
ncbi:MAG TPA: HAD family hydrolase [Candidatus Binatia bacterium]|nr:HAD family hydrolase [Candidatus Binatia bacterium]